MKFWFNMLLLCSALFAIGWFVSFQYDPYNVCVDDPGNKDLFMCEPGGFSLKKGTRLERPADDQFIWEKRGDVIIGTVDPAEKYRREQAQRKAELDQWVCDEKFSQLSMEEFLKLTDAQLTKHCRLRNKKDRVPRRMDAPALEEIPNQNQDL
jgi:hypothetical protein